MDDDARPSPDQLRDSSQTSVRSPPLSLATQPNVSRCSEFHGLSIWDLEARKFIFCAPLGLLPPDLQLTLTASSPSNNFMPLKRETSITCLRRVCPDVV